MHWIYKFSIARGNARENDTNIGEKINPRSVTNPHIGCTDNKQEVCLLPEL